MIFGALMYYRYLALGKVRDGPAYLVVSVFLPCQLVDTPGIFACENASLKCDNFFFHRASKLESLVANLILEKFFKLIELLLVHVFLEDYLIIIGR